jgi:release factor glutamine methyltransferase
MIRATPQPGMMHLRRAINEATGTLAAAGIDSARFDAECLAAHAAGVDRGRLTLHEPDEAFFDRYRELVAARASRIPLQHLITTAPFGPLLLNVGPGVFVPRPETETLLEWALTRELSDTAVIVDLCTGSGALALALAHARPRARVVAVDDSAEALGYARRNGEGSAVAILEADVTEEGVLADYDGRVALLVANPPYIPDGATLEPEVAQHDPAHALFGGPDGMQVIRPIVTLAARLLCPGGQVAVEHDETTAAQTVAVFEAAGVFTEVTSHRDLTGRPRFVSAVRKG